MLTIDGGPAFSDVSCRRWYESHTVEQTVGNFQEAKVGPDKSLEGGAKMRRKLVVSEQAFYPRRSEYEGLNP